MPDLRASASRSSAPLWAATPSKPGSSSAAAATPSALDDTTAWCDRLVLRVREAGAALLGPLPEGSPLERLRAAGKVQSATIDLNDLPAPLVLPSGVESAALRRYLRRRRPVVASALARTEVLRALVHAGEGAPAAGSKVLAGIDLVRINDRVVNAAGTLMPGSLRFPDAMQLATAQQLGPDLRQLVTYDERMAGAAKQLGITLASPG